MTSIFQKLIPYQDRETASLELSRKLLGLLTLLITILAWKAWRTHDLIPMVPSNDSIPVLPFGVDLILPISLIIGSLAILFLKPKPIYHLIIGLVIFYGCLSDLNRCHPWMYQIGWMHFFFLFLSANSYRKTLHTALAIMLSAVYFWSGFHKLNPEYCSWVLPWLLGPFGYPETEPIGIIGYFTALAEIVFAIGFWIPKIRKWAWFGAILMHVFILVSIGPLGHNWNPVVWPWNVAMPIWIWLLFIRQSPEKPIFGGIRNKISVGVVAIIFLLLPGLHTVGAVNGYLSFSLYSGKIPDAVIFLPKEKIFELPESARAFGDVKGDEAYFPLAGWTIDAIGLSPFPSTHYYTATYRRLCHKYPALSSSYMVLIDTDGFSKTRSTVKCGQ